ncbi:hypothetical protein ACIGZJ_21385 [Kitasatospora sp. NPDC052868]|uniref:hypothetical protein n=1 Tax=Kitasatospora sp. NPDC052868 TaxID=3364060 RepID=UPI0037C855F6
MSEVARHGTVQSTAQGMVKGAAQGATLVLGGLGADSHSVGLFVLRNALEAAGFRVVDLGIQNDFARFAAMADDCDAVLISNMDGHAEYYLREVEALPGGCLWYLGGLPAVAGRTGELLARGFARVYGGFVDTDEVVAALAEDLAGRARCTPRPSVPPVPPPRPSAPAVPPPRPGRGAGPDPAGRAEVLAQWPTGAGARDIEANAEVLAARPSLALLQGGAARTLLHPRSGVRGSDDQQELFADLYAAGAEVLSFQVDSLTRDGRYAEVEQVARDGGALNGFPVVNHGVDTLRRISAACPVPLQTRHSARDPRLLAEVSYAGGVTAFEGGPICYNIPYYADLPLAVSLARWRYVDELTARYAELGVVLDREFFGTLTATLIPPALAICTNILEGLLAVGAGVRSVSLAYAEQGSRAQDVAAVEVMGRLGREYLGRGGRVRVATVFHQFMGAFPADREEAEQLIRESARTAALARADRVVVKTPAEALRIPDVRDNARGLALAAAGLELAAADQGAADRAAADRGAVDGMEAHRIERTARHLLEAVLALRPGDVGGCVEEAFATGVLDVPFSPSRYNAGRLLTGRDTNGAVRVIDPGGVPLPPDVLAFETERMRERLAIARVPRAEAWRLVARDVLEASRLRAGWPLDGRRTIRAVG